jgi:CheY-like chemotaxis protein
MNFALSAKPLSILVVDDEQPIRELLGWMLSDAGHVVYEAATGADAVNFLRGEQSVDIVLSDINMPGMDGLELSKIVMAEWPGLPVLLISGRPPPKGVHDFIAKPFRWDTLSNAIAMLAGPDRPKAGCV